MLGFDVCGQVRWMSQWFGNKCCVSLSALHYKTDACALDSIIVSGRDVEAVTFLAVTCLRYHLTVWSVTPTRCVCVTAVCVSYRMSA